MAGPNQSGSIETANDNKDDRNAFSILMSEFSKEKLKNPATRSQYVNELRSAGNITPELLEEIRRFAGKDSSGKYDGLEIIPEKLNYHALVRETGAYFTTISNNKRTLKDLYLQDYDVTDSVLSKKIDWALENQNEAEIDVLLRSDKKRKSFLEEQYGSTAFPTEKSISSFLKELDLNKRYNLLDEEHKSDFIHIVSKIQTGQKIDDIDLEILFESNAYSAKEKEKLLNKLVPSISLAQALSYGIMTQAQALDLKKQQVKENSNKLSSDDINDIVGQIDDSQVRLSTAKFTGNKSNREALINDSRIFEDFAKKYNNEIDNIQENIKQGDMRKSSDFQNALAAFPTVSGSENLKAWSVFEMNQTQTVDGTTKNVIIYGEVKSLSDTWEITFIEKSNDNKYDPSGAIQTTESYADFIKYIEWGNAKEWVSFTSLRILSPAQLDKNIKEGEIKEYQGLDLRLEGRDEIKSDIDDMTRDINGIKQALKDREVQMRNDLSEEWFSKEEIQHRIDSDPWIQENREKISHLEQRQLTKTNYLENIEAQHKEKFIDRLDEIDHDGHNFWLDHGTTFKTKSGHVYTIESVDEMWEQVIMTSLAGQEIVSFEQFYKGFKDQAAARIGMQSNGFSGLMESLSSDDKAPRAWSNFDFTDNSIKRKNSTKKIQYDYLVAEVWEWVELLKIHDISGDRITVSFWEIRSERKKDAKWEVMRDDEGKSVNDEKFSIENKEYTVSAWFLEDYIKENKLVPRGMDDKNEVTKTDEKYDSIKKNFHLFSWMFNERATIADAVKGGHLFYEQLKEMIEMWSDEKANQFALKYMWGLLTADAKRDMQSRLEQKQKKTMEEYVERLETVASDVAVKMIDQWLHDKYGPPFQKEAAVVFMLKKYGVLNAKALQKYEGKYLWYQALGGTPWDDFFLQIKKEKEDQSLPFTEELLVYLFIKKQCHPDGYKWIKRRSKLHKEVKKIRAVGKEEEYETGKRDGNDERDIMWRVNGGIGEMHSNNYPNMVGWLEVAINKWGPMHVMNKIPFMAAYSGVAYNFEEKITDQLKNFPGGTRILMMLRMFSYHKDLDLLNNTILQISKSLQERWDPKYRTMWIEAQELFDDRRNSGGWVKAKLNKTEEFYDKYGKEITDALYMLNTWDTDDTHNKIIFFEKDYDASKDTETDPKKIADKKERAKVFSQYYGLLHAYIGADTSFWDEDLMNDPFKHAGTSGLELHKMAEELLVLRQGQWTKKHAGPSMWEEVEKEFKAIPKRQYHKDDAINKAMQKKLLEDNLRRLVSGIMKILGSNGRELAGYNSPTWLTSQLNEWGIDMTRFENVAGFSVEWLLEGHDAWSNEIISEFADQIISVETNGWHFRHKVNNMFSKDNSGLDIAKVVQTTGDRVNKSTTANDNINPLNSVNPYGTDPEPSDIYKQAA